MDGLFKSASGRPDWWKDVVWWPEHQGILCQGSNLFKSGILVPYFARTPLLLMLMMPRYGCMPPTKSLPFSAHGNHAIFYFCNVKFGLVLRTWNIHRHRQPLLTNTYIGGSVIHPGQALQLESVRAVAFKIGSVSHCYGRLTEFCTKDMSCIFNAHPI